jgi:hypothetical protein
MLSSWSRSLFKEGITNVIFGTRKKYIQKIELSEPARAAKPFSHNLKMLKTSDGIAGLNFA